MGTHTYVTKVLQTRSKPEVVRLVCLLLVFYVPTAQAVVKDVVSDRDRDSHQPGPAESLYLQLSSVGLDSNRVFRVRESSLDRPAIHITLEDGTIAFTQDVMGKITGAFFEGDGEVLLVPPNQVERKSMSLFTGMAILEERFSTAYFRFNDDTPAELQPGFREPEDPQGFVNRWNDVARKLAQGDAMRLLANFIERLPSQIPTKGQIKDQAKPEHSSNSDGLESGDRMLHVRLQGNTLGTFDIFFDSTAGEQVQAGQAKTTEDGAVYYNVWTSFSAGDAAKGHPAPAETLQTLPAETEPRADPVFVRNYVIDAQVRPPKELAAKANLELEVGHDGSRFLMFELSRFLKISSVEQDGRPVEFVQNPAVEGTRLARSGNDLVAVILAGPVRKGQKISLRFDYGGEVLAEAGKGLLYVGARGTWYPNRGTSMSNFDLTFRYPPGWTLVATGKPAALSEVTSQNDNETQTSRWISERPLPVAGFDLGKYLRVAVQAGPVNVETYATAIVERDFPTPAPPVEPDPDPLPRRLSPPIIAPLVPSPARNAAAVAEAAASAIRYYADRFGPYPYSKLALTQVPGRESQGWPGLVFLSSYAFLTHEERQQLHLDATRESINQHVPAHEAAHQWWGDLVTWKTYRDQWFSEGLANYSALLLLREKDPEGFRQIMEHYRRGLVQRNKDDRLPKDAGPVTLGTRLFSSQFPEAYEAITYGRGTWLFYMLHSMMLDAATSAKGKDARLPVGDDPFLHSLRKLRERYEGKAITTRELLEVFAEDLPPSLRYENKSSLEWFLDSWVSGTSLPKLDLQNVKMAAKTNGVAVTGVIRQKEAEDNCVTSVPIYAVISGRPPVLLGRFFADGTETTFHLLAPPGTHKLLLDPNETILTSPK